MAVDNLEIEYHLTPTGWVTGRDWFFGKLQGEDVEPPSDRVLTIVERTFQQSGYSPESVTYRETWRDNPIAPGKIEDLKRMYSLDGYC